MNRRGWEVNHKRILRLMRQDNLLCLRHRSFVVTTDSRHALALYPNLAREIKPSLTFALGVSFPAARGRIGNAVNAGSREKA
jgi:transposase InsO family protein